MVLLAFVESPHFFNDLFVRFRHGFSPPLVDVKNNNFVMTCLIANLLFSNNTGFSVSHKMSKNANKRSCLEIEKYL
jgi:hypothetical protein